MKKLNAQEWADGLCFVAFGVQMGIRVTIPGLLPRLMELLPPGWKPARRRKVRWLFSLSSFPSRRKPGKLIHQLYTGGTLVTRGSDLQRVLNAFGHELRAALALMSAWRVFVHAGAVGWKGRAILLPGSSEAGKSTLTAALVRAGASLYSDEFAVLDRKGRVHPYPLDLRLAEDDGIRTRPVSLAELGGEAGTRPLPVGLVLATRFDPDAPGGLQRISSGRAALTLLAHANQARTRPDRVMETVGAAARDAVCLRGPRGEAEELVDRILGLW